MASKLPTLLGMLAIVLNGFHAGAVIALCHRFEHAGGPALLRASFTRISPEGQYAVVTPLVELRFRLLPCGRFHAASERARPQHENSTRQLAARLAYDDGTVTPLVAAAVGWNVVSGPLRNIDGSGVATAIARD